MKYRPPSLRTLLATLAALALVATSCGGGSADTTTDAAVDSAAPAPTQAEAAPAEEAAPVEEAAPAEASLVATTVSGGQIDFGSLEGQDVVLWFWAPW